MPPPSKKPKRASTPTEVESAVSEYENLIAAAEPVTLDAVVAIRDFLQGSRDSDDEVIKAICSATKLPFVARLLVAYTATQKQADLAIFSIFQLLEKSYKFSLRPLFPLVFGPSQANHYRLLLKLGPAVHNPPSPDQVIQSLHGKLLWETGVEIRAFNAGTQTETATPELYDPRFVLLLLAQVMQPGVDVTLRDFVEHNALSFATFFLSHPDDNLRGLAYSVISEFLAKCQDLSVQDFPECQLFVYVLTYVKNNLVRENTKMGNAFTHFLAYSFKMLLKPGNNIFPKVMSFFVSRPELNFNTIPAFGNFFFSSATETHHDERVFMLKIVKTSMFDLSDFKILEALNGTSLFLSFLTSPICQNTVATLITDILHRVIRIPSACSILYHKYSFHTWVATALTLSQSRSPAIACMILDVFIAYAAAIEDLVTSGKLKKSVENLAWKESVVKQTAKFVKSRIEGNSQFSAEQKAALEAISVKRWTGSAQNGHQSGGKEEALT